MQVPASTTNTSVDELRRLLLNYSRPDKMMSRASHCVIDKLSASSVYSVAIRTCNGFGFSDWTPEYYFETAPGINNVNVALSILCVIKNVPVYGVWPKTSTVAQNMATVENIHNKTALNLGQFWVLDFQ